MVRQRFKNAFKIARQTKEFWDNSEDPQEGLVQIGDSPFYATPDEPADPMDCNRYPDSPFCGGNPLTIKPIDLSVSLVRDECNLGIQFDGAIGFIKVPPAQIVYRNPECISPPPKPEPRPPQDEDYSEYADIPESRDDSDLWLVIPVYGYNYFCFNEENAYDFVETYCNLISIEGEPGNGPVKVTVQVKYKMAFTSLNAKLRESYYDIRFVDLTDDVASWERDGGVINGAPNDNGTIWTLKRTYKAHSYWHGIGDTYFDFSEESYFYSDEGIKISGLTYGTVGFFGARYQELIKDPLRPKNFRYSNVSSDGILTTAVETQRNILPLHEKLSPPPPPKCMCCCPNVEQNDQLLKLILKRIGTPKEVTIFDEDLDRKGAQHIKKKPPSLNDFLKLAVERTEIVTRIVGIENFPLVVPDTVIEPYKEGVFAKIFDFIDGDKKRTIHTIAELIAWQAEQDSAVLGEFHQVIEYETGGTDNRGKPKTGKIVLPNVAETLKEITLLVAQMAKQNNVQTDIIFKLIAETVATRAAASKAVKIVEDIQDYLDYPTERKVEEIQTSINLPTVKKNKEGIPIATKDTESHVDFMKPGSVKFVFEDWTGSHSLHDQMVDLLQLASMLRAIYYQGTDK